MPSFRDLGKDAILDVVSFVKTLGGPESGEGNWFELYEVPPAAKVPPMPTDDDAQLNLGKELYPKIGCAGCHGDTGHGDGKPAEEMLDSWDQPLHARDFFVGVYKGGSRPEDLYLRVLTGMDGTPMTGFWHDAMTPTERWAIVRFMTSLAAPRDIKQPSRATISVRKDVLPSGVNDSAWEKGSGSAMTRMALSGGWMRYFEPLDLRAAASATELAVRVSWDDGENSCPSLRLAFAKAEPPVSFVVGSKSEPVTVWQWTPGEGAVALISTGVESDTPTKDKLSAEQAKQGNRYTLMLKGELPVSAGQMQVSVLGCEGRGSYRTSSTVNVLK